MVVIFNGSIGRTRGGTILSYEVSDMDNNSLDYYKAGVINEIEKIFKDIERLNQQRKFYINFIDSYVQRLLFLDY